CASIILTSSNSITALVSRVKQESFTKSIRECSAKEWSLSRILRCPGIASEFIGSCGSKVDRIMSGKRHRQTPGGESEMSRRSHEDPTEQGRHFKLAADLREHYD